MAKLNNKASKSKVVKASSGAGKSKARSTTVKAVKTALKLKSVNIKDNGDVMSFTATKKQETVSPDKKQPATETVTRTSARLQGKQPELNENALDQFQHEHRERMFLENVVLQTAGQAEDDNEPEPEPDNWTCRHCTQVNAHDESRCGSLGCGKARSLPTNQFLGWGGTLAIATNVWKCTVCLTGNNPIDQTQCGSCGSNKPAGN